MRESVYKRYAKLLKLVALANGEPDDLRDVIMPVGDPEAGERGRERYLRTGRLPRPNSPAYQPYGWADYGPKEKFVPVIREALRRLANAQPPKWSEPSIGIPLPESPPASVTVDFNGRINKTRDFYRDQFLPALEGLEVGRLKICPICDKLFVALRLDQPACSRKCGNAHRAREFRRNAKRYERNRKENRRRKAAREALRRKRK